jgi:ATP-dependent protease HslVU (ClpYQ) peptidase subunit
MRVHLKDNYERHIQEQNKQLPELSVVLLDWLTEDKFLKQLDILLIHIGKKKIILTHH